MVKPTQKSTNSEENLTGILHSATHLWNNTIFGWVVEDFEGRFDPGNWIRTSSVQKIEGDLVYTLNSVYKIEGELKTEKSPSLHNLI